MEGSDVAPASSSDAPGKKDRHVVTWTPQEDDLLREQIALHGTNNWTNISSKFKDKTSRQCRRRWYTYLNSECKKGGWSAEEDMLLCEAQKILGNRWTEIAKVVAGRTDNAVKNRFSTLCKKRAKDENLYKENNVPCVNTDSDRYLFTRDRLISAGIDMSSLPAKKMRYDHLDSSERMKTTNRFLIPEVTGKEQLRQPLLEVSQNVGYSKEPSINGEVLVLTCKTKNNDAKAVNIQSVRNSSVSGAVSKGTFLQKDESKLTALLQQAELLSSLAIRVNTESTKESLDEAWKQLQDYMNQMEKVAVKKDKSDANSILDNLKDLIENLRNGKEPNLQMGLQLQEQSTKASNSESLLDTQIHASGSMVDALFDDLICIPSEEDPISTNEEVGPGASIQLSEKMEGENGSSSANKDLADSIFASPNQKFPAFQSLADAIPSPKFSESERKFLLTVVGMSSPVTNTVCSRDPSCKRALLDSL